MSAIGFDSAAGGSGAACPGIGGIGCCWRKFWRPFCGPRPPIPGWPRPLPPLPPMPPGPLIMFERPACCIPALVSAHPAYPVGIQTLAAVAEASYLAAVGRSTCPACHLPEHRRGMPYIKPYPRTHRSLRELRLQTHSAVFFTLRQGDV